MNFFLFSLCKKQFCLIANIGRNDSLRGFEVTFFYERIGGFSNNVTVNSSARNVNHSKIYNLTASDQVKLVQLPLLWK